jgi:hypothetical protein
MADRLNGAQQENLVSILAHDKTNGKLVAQLADPALFEGEYRVIAERCIDYWRRHKKAPGVHTADLVGDILDDPRNRKAKTFERILRQMQQLSASVNTDYVLQTLKDFTRVQRMKDAILKSAEKLNAQQELAIGEVEVLLADLLRAREIGFDAGLRLTEVDRIMDWLDVHFSEFMTGIAELDRRHIVPARGAALLVLAPTGRGKTWFLVHLGKHGLLQRKKVLHITLEMSAEECAQRYYQNLFSIPKHREKIEIATFTQRKDGRIKDFDRETITHKFSFDYGNIRKVLKKEIKPFVPRGLPNLIIKRFPPRALTMDGLRAYLDALEATENFIPDLLILDYIGIASTDAKNHRISLGRVFEEFRAVCVERNAAGVTAHQVSKVGADAQLVKATHVSEDWSLIGTADQAITYSCTAAEERLGLARLFVAKARSEQDKFGLIITQSYKMGQFVLQSAPLDKDYYDYIEDQRAADEAREDDEPREDDE